ncbi:MAG: 3-hydroxyacyl-CoA dehydrogenase family protein [Peptococcaceae bacterium]|jgi:3-hydroxybutyryl-CoA dehydrogenase|nr:3-hydroxyacyl-CoA dehydrogenase family protein [Peptococcaceae bacterium]MDH7525433.1 3-hydroxyacyl-CoA dehydrogenase family protein [Peptococcaceae bacterium]
MSIKKIAVLGQGQMGSGIAQHAAAKGFQVMLYGRSLAKVKAVVERMGAAMDKSIAKGVMTEEQKAAALANINTTDRLEECADCDIVIEALAEDMELKKSTLAKMDEICKPEAIVATNTSSLSITALAAATKRPDKVIGMHFFNPVHIMKLVELVKGYYTSEETFAAAKELAGALDKVSVKLEKDTPGFIVNRILFAFLLEAVHIYEEGIASKEDIDLAIKHGLNHPMGPFALMDLGGLDTFPSICEYLFAEFKDPKWATPQSIKANVRAGRYGVKNGRGWYDYQK